MKYSRFRFTLFTTYLLYAYLIFIVFSIFGFASYLNNHIATFLLAFVLAASLTGYIFYLLLDNKRIRLIHMLIIFLLSYVFSFISINISTLLNSSFWFLGEFISLSVFSCIWLIIKLLNDIKTEKKNTYYISSITIPFIVMIGYLGVFITSLLPKTQTQVDVLRDRGALVFSRIYEKIEEEVMLEGYELIKLSYIGYDQTSESLAVGGFSSLNAYTYHVYTFNYDGYDSANKVFEAIETNNYFPSFTKKIYIVDEEHSYLENTPTIITDNGYSDIREHYSINYIDSSINKVDAIMRAKINSEEKYITCRSTYDGSEVTSFYAYEGLGNYVIALI